MAVTVKPGPTESEMALIAAYGGEPTVIAEGVRGKAKVKGRDKPAKGLAILKRPKEQPKLDHMKPQTQRVVDMPTAWTAALVERLLKSGFSATKPVIKQGARVNVTDEGVFDAAIDTAVEGDKDAYVYDRAEFPDKQIFYKDEHAYVFNSDDAPSCFGEARPEPMPDKRDARDVPDESDTPPSLDASDEVNQAWTFTGSDASEDDIIESHEIGIHIEVRSGKSNEAARLADLETLRKCARRIAKNDPSLFVDMCEHEHRTFDRDVLRINEVAADKALSLILTHDSPLVLRWFKSGRSQRAFAEAEGMALTALRRAVTKYCACVAGRLNAAGVKMRANTALYRNRDIIFGVTMIADALAKNESNTKSLKAAPMSPVAHAD